MKSRTLCALTLLFISTIAFSQLKVISNGNVGIGSGATNPVSDLSVGGDNGTSLGTLSVYGKTGNAQRTLRITQPINSAASETNYGIVSQIAYGEGGYKLYAIYANAYRGATAYDDARTYGVLGLGGNGLQGRNYGVFGSLQGTRNGAAIFGSLDQDEPLTAIDDQYAGYFMGDVKITGDLNGNPVCVDSDINLKKDIAPIEDDVLTRLAQLQTIKFKKKHPSEYLELSDSTDMERVSREMQSDNYTRERLGLIAQELQTTFPEVVKEGSDGYLRVRYTELIPVLIQAINQQQQQIEYLKSQIESPAVAKASQGLTTSSVDSYVEYSGTATLQQNIPNPFNENTIVTYSIPIIESHAMINIYDLQGGQVKSYRIQQIGEGEIHIPASELNPGMYIYNLIVDGQEVSSRRMVLTD